MTDFGKDVRKRLIDRGETQRWLCAEITRRTGLYMDSGYLGKILSGRRASPRVLAAIREILDLPEGERDASAP